MCAEVTADLHLHTTASDGTLTVDELPDAAHAAGLQWLAVTDHDRVHPGLSGPVTTSAGISIIRGIELRVQTDTQRLDFLGYGVEPTPALTRETKRLQTDRIERAEAIVDRVEDRLEVDLGFEADEGVGRPHVATAIAESAAPYDYDGAFADLIGEDCPCYVSREITPVDEGLELLGDSCRVVSLAHPLRYDDPETALEYATAVDAVERYYPYEKAVDSTPVSAVADRHDLCVTGGSDAHGQTLGAAGLSETQFEAFYDRFSSTGAPVG
jgi:predicted metal-dependent phosphoesterase TrpH